MGSNYDYYYFIIAKLPRISFKGEFKCTGDYADSSTKKINQKLNI